VPAYVIRRAAAVARDFSAIRRHLIRSYEGFGDTHAVAAERAAARLRGAFDYMQTFATHPHRGTLHPELKGRIRHVTDKNSVFYFEIEEREAEVRVLAVFFGGADHVTQITERLTR